MKKIKKLIAGIMAVVCMGTLMIGCGNNKADTNNSTSTSSQSASTNTSDKNTDTQNTNNNNNNNNNASGSQEVYEQDFTLVNQTGVEIYELYISPSEENQWGEDVLTVDTLPSGQSVEIKFAPQEKSQYWDLMVVDNEGTTITWEKIDLFTVSEVALQFDGTTPTASFK